MSHCLQPDGLGAEYGFVMPFVVCQSVGGPYEDAAFVAGWQAAAVDASLSQKPDTLRVVLATQLAPQIDLIAMHRGYVVRVAVSEAEPSWTLYQFDKIEDTPDEVPVG